jgi:predicted nucleic-acid-binding protein
VKRLVFDSDVLLDVLLARQPFWQTSAQALDTLCQDKVEGYLAGHAVTNLFYLLRRHLGANRSREVLTTLLSKLQVAAVTDAVIREALSANFPDFEDAVTHAAARTVSADAILTRNLKDFRTGTISAILPETWLGRHERG